MVSLIGREARTNCKINIITGKILIKFKYRQMWYSNVDNFLGLLLTEI